VYTYVGDKKLWLEEISVLDVTEINDNEEMASQDKEPWIYIQIDKKTYGVICADKKILLLHQVKPEWKKSMDMVSFLNGNKELFQ
jgi:methionyl-tRNA formyltransferase